MSTNEKNRFSTLLEELISISGVKNSGLAKALQYDASYISKWVSGRLLPTEKTKKKILSGLSHEIVSQSTSEGLENLYAKSPTTSSTGGLILALQRAILLLAPQGGVTSTFTGPL